MDALEIFDEQIAALNRKVANWDRLLEMLRSSSPAGRLGINNVWETTEEAIARFERWRLRETLAIEHISKIRQDWIQGQAEL